VSLKHAILVLLDQQAASGYDLHKRFQQHMGFFWQASHQQIYQQLKGLLNDDMIGVEDVSQQGKPDRKEYRITDMGRQSLIAWMQQSCKPMKVNDSLLLKLYGGHLVDKAYVLKDLQQQKDTHEKTLSVLLQIEQQYQAMTEQDQQLYQLRYLTLRRGIHHVNAWLAWAEEAQQVIERQPAPC
jgi:PadR family transcriptional regulator AphA